MSRSRNGSSTKGQKVHSLDELVSLLETGMEPISLELDEVWTEVSLSTGRNPMLRLALSLDSTLLELEFEQKGSLWSAKITSRLLPPINSDSEMP